MSVEFGHLSSVARAYPVPPAAPVRASERADVGAAAAPPPAGDRVELSHAAAPPPEALAMVDRAARRVEELAAEGRELHFAYNEDARRVVVQVRDLDGKVIRTIPPASALEVLGGAVLEGEHVALTLTGLASGVDTDSIVEQLMALERQTLTRNTTRQKRYEAEATGLKDVQTRLKTLKTALADLKSVTLWGNAQSVTSSDAGRVTAKVASGQVALPQSLSVTVTGLATARRDDYAWGGQAAISFAHPTDTTKNVTVSLAAGARTIDDAIKAINASDAPVWATKDATGNLLMQRREAGATPTAWTVAFDGVQQTDASPVPGTNTQYQILRGGVDVTPAEPVTSNAVVFEGIELTFNALTAANTPVVVGVAEPGVDETKIKAKVSAFITAYNDVVSKTREKLDEKVVVDATTTYDASKGQLFGDTGLSAMLSRMRQKVTDKVGADTAFDQLLDVGISTGKSTGATATSDQKLGKLALDEDAFASALKDPARLRTLLSGVASSLEDFVEEQVKTSGVLESRLKVNSEAVDRAKDAYTRAEERITVKEKRLKAQFAAMESAMAAAQTQQEWLTGQIAGLPSWSS